MLLCQAADIVSQFMIMTGRGGHAECAGEFLLEKTLAYDDAG